jgi:hypothetical protein
VLKGADRLEDGSGIIREDKLNIRNGCRIQYATSYGHVQEMLSLYFEDMKIGYLKDVSFNFHRELYYFVCRKK